MYSNKRRSSASTTAIFSRRDGPLPKRIRKSELNLLEDVKYVSIRAVVNSAFCVCYIETHTQNPPQLKC